MRFTWAVLSTLEAGPDLEQGGWQWRLCDRPGGGCPGKGDDVGRGGSGCSGGNGLGRSGPLNFILSEFEPPRVHERT